MAARGGPAGPLAPVQANLLLDLPLLLGDRGLHHVVSAVAGTKVRERLRHEHVLFTERPEGRLLVPRIAELAHDQHVERAAQALGDLVRDHHAAARDSVHERLIGADVGQLFGEQAARLAAVGESRRAQVAGLGSGALRRARGCSAAAASTSSWSEVTRPSCTRSMSSIASKSPSRPKLILPL